VSTGTDRAVVLSAAVEHLGIDERALWLDYLALSGNASPARGHDWLSRGASIPDADYDKLAHARNEAFSERGQDSPVPYVEDP